MASCTRCSATRSTFSSSRFCPHLKSLFIATHSHIFLDRSAYENNFVVTKRDKLISARQLNTASDLHEVQFNMLGNDLELLYLPAAIVLVEGEPGANREG